MNDKSNLINLFRHPEENPRQEFTMSQIGVVGVSEAEKQQIVHNYDETLDQAAPFFADVQPVQAPEDLREAA
jgi:Holliday junction resolvasome RuvABC endonuclease subunit